MAAGVRYDALVVVSFGGPEGPDDVEPFLDNVLRGRPVPPERREAVAAHYRNFGGRSPLNDNNRALVAAIGTDLRAQGIALPVYWGNRNWQPFLADTVAQMRDDGVRRAAAFVTSGYASASGCRQYLDDIARAREAVGKDAPEIDKLRVFYNHPGFVQANGDALAAALTEAGGAASVAFTAHSIPLSRAATCDYEAQLTETARLVVERVAPHADLPWSLAFQSRSGPATQRWLEPDIGDHLRALAAAGTTSVVVAPIGFISDHMEVVYDLDLEAQQLATRLGLRMVRAATAGVHPAFVAMVRQLVAERQDPPAPQMSLGNYGPYHDVCHPDCCRPVERARPSPDLAATGQSPAGR